MSAVKISAVIITYNEERNIGRCLESLQAVADEIVVVDSFSVDRTEAICAEYGVRFLRNTFEGHIQQKNHAVDEAAHDIVLALDADECLSDELKKEILKIKANWRADAYAFNRLNNYCGRWIRHCGWYPDRKVRLWDRRKGRWGGKNPHDTVIVEKGATVENVPADLLHYSYAAVGEHVLQINKFSSISAEQAFARNKKPYVVPHLLFYPFFIFIKTYIIKLGVLDGYYGFVLSVNSAYYAYLKYLKLMELRKAKRKKRRPGSPE